MQPILYYLIIDIETLLFAANVKLDNAFLEIILTAFQMSFREKKWRAFR